MLPPPATVVTQPGTTELAIGDVEAEGMPDALADGVTLREALAEEAPDALGDVLALAPAEAVTAALTDCVPLVETLALGDSVALALALAVTEVNVAVAVGHWQCDEAVLGIMAESLTGRIGAA